jgi:hypothetical protein
MATHASEGGADWIASDRLAYLSRHSVSTLRRNVGNCNSGGNLVTMMQTAEPWHGYNPLTYNSIPFRFTTRRRSFAECQMRPVFAIVTNRHSSRYMKSADPASFLRGISIPGRRESCCSFLASLAIWAAGRNPLGKRDF